MRLNREQMKSFALVSPVSQIYISFLQIRYTVVVYRLNYENFEFAFQCHLPW